jgi:hypothetical protein
MLSQLLAMKRHGMVKDEDWEAILELRDHDLSLAEEDEIQEEDSRKADQALVDGTSPMDDNVIRNQLERAHSKVALTIAGLPSSDKDIKNAISLQNKVRPIANPSIDANHPDPDQRLRPPVQRRRRRRRLRPARRLDD